MPEPISKSGNEWSLEEIPAEEEILAGRGGSSGRPGRSSGESSWRGRLLPPGASVVQLPRVFDRGGAPTMFPGA